MFWVSVLFLSILILVVEFLLLNFILPDNWGRPIKIILPVAVYVLTGFVVLKLTGERSLALLAGAIIGEIDTVGSRFLESKFRTSHHAEQTVSPQVSFRIFLLSVFLNPLIGIVGAYWGLRLAN